MRIQLQQFLTPERIGLRTEDMQRMEVTDEKLKKSACCLINKYNLVYMVLKPPPRQHSKNSTPCRERGLIQAQKRDVKGLMNGRRCCKHLPVSPPPKDSILSSYIRQPGLISTMFKCQLGHKIAATLCRSK